MPSAFTDRSAAPTSEDLAEALGEAADLWHATISCIEPLATLTSDWSWGGSRSGWLLRVARRTKPVLYLIPERGSFRAALAIPERVHDTPAWASLPDEVRTLVDAAPSYPEGRAVRFAVTCPADLATVETLVRTKLTL